MTVLIGGALLAAFAVAQASEPAIDARDLEDVRSSARGAYILVYLALLGFFCTRVGYRAYDTLFGIIPFYGVIFASKIVWRFANLPHRYWDLDYSNLPANAPDILATTLIPTVPDSVTPPGNVQRRSAEDGKPRRTSHVLMVLLAFSVFILPAISIVATRNNWIAGLTGKLYTERETDRLTAAASRAGYDDGHATGFLLGRSAGRDAGKEEALTEMRDAVGTAEQRGCESVFDEFRTDRLMNFWDFYNRVPSAEYVTKDYCLR